MTLDLREIFGLDVSALDLIFRTSVMYLGLVAVLLLLAGVLRNELRQRNRAETELAELQGEFHLLRR